jgi:hypothetical protein
VANFSKSSAILVFVIILFHLAGCQKDVSPSNPTIYIVGYDNLSGRQEPILWKNGIASTLSTAYADVGYTTSVALSGSDIRCRICQCCQWVFCRYLWKNGLPTSLSDGTRIVTANAVTTSGSDVYVVGDNYNTSVNMYSAILWKNGIASSLPGGNNGSSAHSVVVSGSDVYISGAMYSVINGIDTAVSTLWKNGVASSLTQSDVYPNAIAISGNDI